MQEVRYSAFNNKTMLIDSDAIICYIYNTLLLMQSRNNMNTYITYINHSGFLIEWDNCYWLFDYYKGQIPDLDYNKLLMIFVSHSHSDHFNPEIFNLYEKHPKTLYIMSSDIKINERTKSKYGITDEIYQRINVVYANKDYEIFDDNQDGINISTLKSTDCGFAFLIRYKEKTIYHAGDLNLWVWMGEDKQHNNNMRARFIDEISRLKDLTIDLAFAPLDPRQEEWYGLGMDLLLDTARVSYVFPMHFWDKPETILKYKNDMAHKHLSTNIMEIKQEGQFWSLEL